MPNKNINYRQYSTTNMGNLQLVRGLQATPVEVANNTVVPVGCLIANIVGAIAILNSPSDNTGRIYILKNSSGGNVTIKDSTIPTPQVLFTLPANACMHVVSTGSIWLDITPNYSAP